MAPTVPKTREINWATVGCVGYVLTFAIPLPWDVSLIWLGASGLLMAMFNNVRRMHWREPLSLETILFVGAMASATALSSSFTLSLTFSASFLPAILLFYVLAFGLTEVNQIRQFFVAICVVVLTLSCFALWTASNMQDATPTDWIEAISVPILVVPNDLIFLAVVAPFSLTLCIGRHQRWIKVLALASLLASLLAIVIFQSRSALLTFLIGVGIMGIIYRPRLAVYGIISVTAATVLLDGVSGFPLASKFTQLSDRLALWVAALSMLAEHPIFGYGPHTFGVHYEAHLDRITLPSWITPNINFTPWPHNLFLETGAELGALGLGLMMLLLSRCFWILRGAFRGGDQNVQILVMACIGSLGAFCAASMVELTFLRIWVVVTLFLLVGIAACLGRISGVPHRLR